MSIEFLFGTKRYLSDTTPAAPGGSVNVVWTSDGENISGSVPDGSSFMVMSGAPEAGQIPQWNEEMQEWAPADISAGGDLAAKEVGIEQTVVGLRGTPIEDYKPDDRSLLEYDTAENQWCPTKVIAPDSAIFHKPDDIVFGPNWQNWNPVIQSAPGMPITNVVITYAYYLRVGPVVFFSVGFNAEITGVQMQASFRVSLPVATVSSNFHACACYGAQDVNVSPTVCPGFISEDDLVIFGPEKGPHVTGKWRFGASGNYRCSDARTIEKPWRTRE